MLKTSKFFCAHRVDFIFTTEFSNFEWRNWFSFGFWKCNWIFMVFEEFDKTRGDYLVLESMSYVKGLWDCNWFLWCNGGI